MKIFPAHVAKINSNCEKNNYLNNPKWRKRRLALPCHKKTASIIKRNNFGNNGNFYCLHCLHSFRVENELKSHEKVCKNKYFCGISLPAQNNNILQFNQYMKPDKMPYIVYADF